MPVDTSFYRNATVFDQVLTRLLAAGDPHHKGTAPIVPSIFCNARVARYLPIETLKWSETPGLMYGLLRNDKIRRPRQDKLSAPSYITSQLWKIRIQHLYRQILTVSSLVEGHDEVEGI